MKKQFLSYLSSVCLLMLLLMLCTGCNGDKEKQIVGTWSNKTVVDGVKSNSVFIFKADGNFLQRLVTKESNTLGFAVQGTWEIDAFGDLTLSYNLSSLKALPTPDFYDPDGEIEKQYLSHMRQQIQDITNQGGSYEISFDDDGEHMILTSQDGKERYTRIRREITTTAQGAADKPAKSTMAVVRNLPQGGSIHQFDILSKQYLAETDLAGLSSAHLRIVRNAIYALHDYNFDSADLREYFGKFHDFTPLTKDANLNQVELANVALIKSLE